MLTQLPHQQAAAGRGEAATRTANPPTPASTGYLVSPQNQHVLPAKPGEILPLQLGRNLQLDVSRKWCQDHYCICSPQRIMAPA